MLVFKDQYRRVNARKHRYWDFQNQLEFVTFDINSLYFSERNTERLYRNNPILQQHISQKLENNELGMLYVDDLLQGIVAPGEHLYIWQDAGAIKLERITLNSTQAVPEHIELVQIAQLDVQTDGREKALTLH